MCSHKNEMQVFSARFYADGVKAIPHKERLPTLYGIALGNLPKNLTTHLTHKLCAVLPKIFLADCLYIFCESCYTDRGSTAPVPHAGFARCCRKNCSAAMTGQHLKKRGEPFCLPN